MQNYPSINIPGSFPCFQHLHIAVTFLHYSTLMKTITVLLNVVFPQTYNLPRCEQVDVCFILGSLKLVLRGHYGSVLEEDIFFPAPLSL